MITLQQTQQSQEIRCQCLLRAFADINQGFTDWYKATQDEIEHMEQELTAQLALSD